MSKMTALFLAYAAVWSGLYLFLLHIVRRVRRLENEVEALRRIEESES